jgi:hypothetical protein
VHIVGPEVGTSAALFATAAQPERVASVIVGTDGAAVQLQLGEPWRAECLTPTSISTQDARPTTSRVVIIDAGHSVWNEAPVEYASATIDAITGK